MRYVLGMLLLIVSLPEQNKGVTHKLPSEPMCIAATLKSEAQGEPLKGKRAVYDTIRTRMKKTGKSACDVVLSPHQFTGMTLKKVMAVSKKDLQMYWVVATMSPVCRNCEWFHRWDVQPTWRHSVRFAGQHGQHYFYKSKERV